MKRILGMAIILTVLVPSNSEAAMESLLAATLTGVRGNVTVLDREGKGRNAHEGFRARSGETVALGDGAKTILKIFDGSELVLKPNTRIVIDALKQPARDEKNIKFSLTFGGVKAAVRKLMTSTSSFEIEAGGVVCGVRGTEFTIDYDLVPKKVDLRVFEGSVYARAGKEKYILGPGEEREFIQTHPGSYRVLSSAAPPEKSRESSLPRKEVEWNSGALLDLDDQFMGTFSITGMSLSDHPSLGGFAQPGFRLTSVAPVLPGVGQVLQTGKVPFLVLH